MTLNNSRPAGTAAAPIIAISNLEDLYGLADSLDVTPGWLPRPVPIMAAVAKSKFRPAIWHYRDIHAALESAGPLIDVELAERRNLVLRNPIEGNDWATSRTLVCAYQMILPGEAAPSHRHSSNALRFIIDGVGSYSIVDGEKMPMETGDVVLTPGGHYHGHGHDGDQAAYWLDCLDVPLTRLFETSFMEAHDNRYEPVTRVVSESPYRFSRASISGALDQANPEGEGHRGPRVTLETVGMQSIGLNVERLPGGKATRRWRSSANRIYAIMAGSGRSEVDGTDMEWMSGDTFVVPAKYWSQHFPSEDSQILEISDEPLLRFANHYIEEFGQ